MRQVLRGLALGTFVATGMLACGEVASAPEGVQMVPLSIATAFAESPGPNAVFGSSVDRVYVNVQRQNESLAAEETIMWPARDEGLRLAIDVPLEQEVETLYVYVQLMAGPQVTMWYGSQQIVLRSEVVPPTPELELFYLGPGYDGVNMTITPRTSFVIPGGTVNYTASVFNGQGQPVTPPIGWSVSDTRLATVSTTGVFAAKSQPGTVYLRAATPTGLADSILVTISNQQQQQR